MIVGTVFCKYNLMYMVYTVEHPSTRFEYITTVLKILFRRQYCNTTRCMLLWFYALQ